MTYQEALVIVCSVALDVDKDNIMFVMDTDYNGDDIRELVIFTGCYVRKEDLIRLSSAINRIVKLDVAIEVRRKGYKRDQEDTDREGLEIACDMPLMIDLSSEYPLDIVTLKINN